jgi:hypothetical protein
VRLYHIEIRHDLKNEDFSCERVESERLIALIMFNMDREKQLAPVDCLQLTSKYTGEIGLRRGEEQS